MIGLNINQEGIDFIKKFEGKRNTSYQDVAGVWTVGYGHTAHVTPHMVIDDQEAESLLKSDLQGFVKGVNDLLKSPTNQNQFNALVSFAYNLGLGNLKISNLLKFHNQRTYNLASMEFLKWNKAHVNGKLQEVQGLTNRRTAEKALYLKPVPPALQDYTVRSGESLSKIALRMSTTVQHLLLLNPQIKDKNVIFAGQRIKVPVR